MGWPGWHTATLLAVGPDEYGEDWMQRPGPFLALAVGLFDDTDLARAVRAAVATLPGSKAHWFGVWTWMLTTTASQYRIGRLTITADDAAALGVDLADIAAFARLLQAEGKVSGLTEAPGELMMRISNWRLWQSLAPAEQSWARRERAAGREPDPSVAVGKSAHGVDNQPVSVGKSADETPSAWAPKTRLDKTTSSYFVIRARAREAAGAIGDAFGEDDDFRLRLEDRIVARLEATGSDGGEAVRAAHRLLSRLAEGWTPDRNDGGVAWMLTLIGTQIEVSAEQVAGVAAAPAGGGSGLVDYIDGFDGDAADD